MISIYVETTVVSYIAARPSRIVIVAAQQQLTTHWWRHALPRFDLRVSPLVRAEAARGDAAAASLRLKLIHELPEIPLTATALDLAQDLTRALQLPARASADAAHVALAAVAKCEYLVTWNCKHIANPGFRRTIDSVCLDRGHTAPVICTPAEMLEVTP